MLTAAWNQDERKYIVKLPPTHVHSSLPCNQKREPNRDSNKNDINLNPETLITNCHNNYRGKKIGSNTAHCCCIPSKLTTVHSQRQTGTPCSFPQPTCFCFVISLWTRGYSKHYQKAAFSGKNMSLTPITPSNCVSVTGILHKPVWMSCIWLFSSLSYLTPECLNATTGCVWFTRLLPGVIKGSICMQNPHRPTSGKLKRCGDTGQRMERGMLPCCYDNYRNVLAGSWWFLCRAGEQSWVGGQHPCYVSRGKKDMKWGLISGTAQLPPWPNTF